MFVKFNLRPQKWLIDGPCSPKLNHLKNYPQVTGSELEYYYSKYENVVVLGDFTAEKSNLHMGEFGTYLIQKYR